MKGLMRLVVIGVAFATAIIAQPYRLVMIQGDSMNPTFESGQIVLASRLVPKVRHGDVVVFKHDGESIVKRVAFVGGDSLLEVKFRGEWIVPQNDFLLAVANRRHYPKRHRLIPEGQVYVLGDNSSASIDSRVFGTVSESDILERLTVDPQPDLITGFAGTAILDDQTMQVVVRSMPLAIGDLPITKGRWPRGATSEAKLVAAFRGG